MNTTSNGVAAAGHQIQVRASRKFLLIMMREKKRLGCSLGDAVLRAAARGMNIKEEVAVVPKLTAGRRPLAK